MLTNVVNTFHSPDGDDDTVRRSADRTGASGDTLQMPGGPRPPRRRGGAARRAFAAFSVLALGGLALAGGLTAYKLGKIGGAGGIGGLTGWWTLYKEPRKFFPSQDRLNVVLIGKDYNRDSRGMPFTKNARADSIMVLSLDLETERVSALSVPRDTWVHAPDGQTGKINGTLARGGPKLLQDTLGELLSVRPDYYIALKPDAVKAVVDKLGGVEVETLDQMEYNDWWGQLFVKLPAGKQRINGEQAVGFTRFREVDIYRRNPDGSPVLGRGGLPVMKRRSEIVHSKEEGDPRRVARQQQLIQAMIREGKKPQNLMKADQVIETALGQVDTNLEPKQVFALAAMFRDMQPESMQTAQLLGRGVKGRVWHFEPDPEKTRLLSDWLLKGDERAADRLTVVAVQNGTKVSGAARKVSDFLEGEGFNARTDRNPPRPAEGSPAGEPAQTVVTYRKAMFAPRAQRVARLIGAKSVVKDTSPAAVAADAEENAPDVTVVIGLDVAAAMASQRSARL